MEIAATSMLGGTSEDMENSALVSKMGFDVINSFSKVLILINL